MAFVAFAVGGTPTLPAGSVAPSVGGTVDIPAVAGTPSTGTVQSLGGNNSYVQSSRTITISWLNGVGPAAPVLFTQTLLPNAPTPIPAMAATSAGNALGIRLPDLAAEQFTTFGTINCTLT